MATPKAALQAVFGTNFEAVGNGVNAEPAARLTIHNQSQPPLLQAKPPPWMFHISPVKLLFEDRMDMDKVCDWFMQTTETRSLAITGRSEAGKKLGESEAFRLIRRQPGAPRRRRKRAARGRVADPVGDCSPDNSRAQGTRRGAARGRGEGWNLHHPILNNWWSGKSRKRQRETPTAAPPGHQERRKGDKNCGQDDYLTDWSDFPSPAVLHVTGTDYKLVPVGNPLPAMWHLGATGGQQLGTGRQQREEEEGTCPGRQQQENLLTEAKRQLGCLRECWVLLRNIRDPQALAPSQSAPWASGKSTSVRLHHRKERRWAPAHYKQRAPDPPSGAEGDTEEHQRDSRLTESQQVLSVNRAQDKANPTAESHPYAHSPAFPELGPANSTHLQSPVKNEEQECFPASEVQPENSLAGVKWQLIHLKECRVILRKIKPMDSSHPNGLAVYQASNLPSPSPCRDLENKEDNKNSEKAELHQINPGSYSCKENQKQCLAADVPVFAKGFNSTSELESTVKPEQDLRNTLVDNEWKLRGLKECRVVLKRITLLGGNHFINLADGQFFRFCRDNHQL